MRKRAQKAAWKQERQDERQLVAMQKEQEAVRLSQTLSTMVDFKSDQKSSPFSSGKSGAELQINVRRAGAQIPDGRAAEKVPQK